MVNRPNLRIPLDVVIERGEKKYTVSPEAVKASDRIVDAGIKTMMLLEEFVSTSQFVLWNGPLGVYQEGFNAGTEQLAKAITRSNVTSIVGGGDTIASLEDLGLMDKFGFVSTGGGAMLDFLANETLPGIEVLKR
jgi:phosphoglycerate kinase